MELPAAVLEQVKELKKSIAGEKDARWAYNTETMEPFTYAELFARRDEIRYPGQTFPAHINAEYRDSYELYKKEGAEAARLRDAGQDLTNEATKMTDEELLEIINIGGVAMTGEDLDKMADAAMSDETQVEDDTSGSTRKPKPQKKPSQSKFYK